MVNFSSLKTQAEIALVKLTEGKFYELENLDQRLQKVADDHPHDTVIKAVARVIEQMKNKNPSGIISQGKIEKIYNDLIGLNVSGTKFRSVLGDLLISEKPNSVEPNKKFAERIRDNSENEVKLDLDENVKNGFEKLFGQVSDKYDHNKAKLAQEKINLELNSLGFKNNRIKIAGGNSEFLVFSADIDTNRGTVRTYIPTEASGEKFPSVFISGNQFDELKKENLNSYIVESSFRKSHLPTVSNILNTLKILTSKSEQKDDEFKKVASYLGCDNEDMKFSAPELFADLPNDKIVKDVQIPKTTIPKPLKVLASQIEENLVETSIGYPQITVRLAKKMVNAELTSMGFKNSQTYVKEATNDGFICEAVINTPKGKMPIEVPIEIKNDFPLLPSVFAKDDYIAEFNVSNIKNFILKNTDFKSIVRDDSPLNEMTLSELKNIIVKSAMAKEYDICNDSLNVIEKKFGGDIHRNIVSDYYKMLVNINNTVDTIKQAYNDSDQFIKTPNSLYPIHKKFGRPAHELIRDENGVYHLKSSYNPRKNNAEGGFFSNAKILVGD